MKYLLAFAIASAFISASAQTPEIPIDLSIPIPRLRFDDKGSIVMTASATSSNTDFDFLIGKWTLKHTRLKSRLTNSHEWEKFETSLEDTRILEGAGNMDVGHDVVNGKPWEGRTIRLFNPQTRLWSLYWVTSATGVMDPPVVGSYENDIGHFFCRDVYKGKNIIMMFRWDKRDKEHAVWSQAFSEDNGKTWEWNWTNTHHRVN